MGTSPQRAITIAIIAIVLALACLVCTIVFNQNRIVCGMTSTVSMVAASVATLFLIVAN